jgi:hypothetical protein
VPVAGNLSNGSISIVDISLTGAKLQHNFPLSSGRRVRLDFSLRGERISLSCDVVRCRAERTESKALSYYSGLRFSDPAELAHSPLRHILTDIVARDLEERRKVVRDDDSPIIV